MVATPASAPCRSRFPGAYNVGPRRSAIERAGRACWPPTRSAEVQAGPRD
jgi:hypothetical protein